jgi:tetratricopeptide (TPR) repeat protein
LENEPDDLWILSYKANALINIQKNIEAREIFKIIQAANRTKDDPSEERILNDMGWSYIENKEFVTGLKYAEDALKINSTEGYILDTKCEALRKLKRYGEAKECYEEKYKITKDETDRIWIGICLLNLGNQEEDVEEKQKYYKDSIEIFNLVIEKDPTNPYGWYNKARTNEVLKKYGEAKKNVFEAIKHNQNVDIFWDELAKICSKEKNNEQAIMYYDVSLGIIADSTIFYKKANILYELGRYEEAITCYDKSLEIKFSIDTIIAKGDALHMSLNYKEAITCYDKAIEKDPEHERAFSNKGNTLREMRKYKESLECLKRAIEIDPTDFYNVDMQSQTYREWGKYEKALEINEQMLKKFPDDKESIYQSFIEIYQGMNDQNKVEEYKEKLQKLRDLK